MSLIQSDSFSFSLQTVVKWTIFHGQAAKFRRWPTGPRTKWLAKFRLHKVANNTRGRDSTKGKEARKTRNAPFMTPRIPGAANLNAVLIRLPASKVKKKKKRWGGRGENMCNLSRKEGSSLFAVLAKRQRKTLPKNLHFHVGWLCVSFLAQGDAV